MFAAGFAREGRRVGVAALAVLATCAAHAESKSRNKNATAPAPTLLNFNWGPELDANVFAIREEFSLNGDAQTISRLEAQFHLHAQRTGDRYTLTFSNLVMKLDDRPIPESAQPAMMGPIMGLVLSYDIASNGDFVGLHDISELQSYAERGYIERNQLLPPAERPTPQEAEQAMKSGSSPQMLQLDSSRTWGALVGMWAGITLTEGKPLTSDAVVTVPVINMPVTMHSTFELVRREECVSGERKRDCVRLRATSRPDATQLAQAQSKLRESMGRPVQSPSLASLQVEDRYEVLTDPATMKPRWAEWTRGADIGNEPDSDNPLTRQSVRTRMIFVYSGRS